MRFSFAILAMLIISPAVFGADIVRLTPDTWNEFAPQGKEVDCIYGDYVLRNEKLVAVIADPLPTRNANMTVKSVGAMIIDLTQRGAPNDQLSCYYANGMPLEFANPESVQVRVAGERTQVRLDLKASGNSVEWEASTTSASGLDVTTRYKLSDDQAWLVAETILKNSKTEVITQEISDLIRADRTFDFGNDERLGLFWANDEFFRQGYGVLVEARKLKRGGNRGSVLQMLDSDGSDKVTLKPGESFTISRKIFPGASLLEIRQVANGLANVRMTPLTISVEDSNGPVPDAKLSLTLEGAAYGSGYTDTDGKLALAIPPGKIRVVAESAVRDSVQEEISVGNNPGTLTLTMKPCGFVVGNITDHARGSIPCKMAFYGQDGTPTPDYGPDSTDTAVQNLYYSHNGKFRQPIRPGKYEVVISFGPEYDAVFKQITIEPGRGTALQAELRRTVNTTGWVSTDFHSHSSPSGDNTASQLGRVQNLLCEHLEFCPCTEHNRVDSYEPWLGKLGVEHLMATCTGMELTGQLLPINHQNAFPLVHKPRTQDGGGPVVDQNPVVQIERLALWDNGSDKLVQENHPNLVQLFADKDENGEYDGGFAKMLDFMDVVEVHPLQNIFEPPTRNAAGKLSRNPAFHWMQLLNLGYRIPGVANTDAHYNFHGSGWLRNYIKSETDDPAKIKTMDMVHASEQGHVVMTTGPFMEVSLQAKKESPKRRGIPGDDVVAPGGAIELQIRVQCSNWLDINRVQVFLNGRPDKGLNFTRRETPEHFRSEVVKFDATLPINLKQDTHVIVAAIGEGLELGRVMGPERGKQVPVALANPIFVDLDGDGFKPNGDVLDLPFPSAR